MPLPAGEVQNVQNATVYVFGGSDITEDEINTDDIELPELRTRSKGTSGAGKRKKKTKNVSDADDMVHVEKEIKDGDTLQTLSLQYGCPVSELKRINNLIADQDFYARRTLKVPMRRDGILLELEESASLPNSNHFGPNLVNGHRHSSDDDDNFSDDSQTEFVRTISIPGSLDGENKAAQAFFNKMDKDLHNILEKTNTHKDSLQEVTSVLKETRFRPLAFPKAQPDCPNDGATLGCTFRNLVIAIIIIVIVIPLVILYAVIKGIR